MTKAELIINETKKKIKDFIVYEMALIYHAAYTDKVDFSEDGEFKLRCGDDIDEIYLKFNRFFEFNHVDSVILTLDDNVFVCLGDEDFENWHDFEWDELNVYDLAKIADALENKYNNLIKK